MGKTVEDMKHLSVLIDSTDSKADVDNAPAEFKKGPGRPKKVKVEPQPWCGMLIPGEIFSVCEYMKKMLIEQSKYTSALDLQIYNAAVQQYLYNDLISKMISGKEPVPVRAVTTTSEALRRALQSLGLTVTDKKSGITKEQTEVNPLAAFLEKMEDDGQEEVIMKKPKKKGSK